MENNEILKNQKAGKKGKMMNKQIGKQKTNNKVVELNLTILITRLKANGTNTPIQS